MSRARHVLIGLSAVLIAVVNPWTLSQVVSDQVLDGVRFSYVVLADLLLIAVAIRLAIVNRFRALSFGLFLLVSMLCVEAASVMAFGIINKEWPWDFERRMKMPLFDPHPYLVGVPRPNARHNTKSLQFSHNSLGFRGPKLEKKKEPGAIRIVAIGGSSTYGSGVDDRDTWPVQLQERLGPGYEIVNFGVPGYSSVEHIVQSAFYPIDLEADGVIFYLGWNEAPNMHIKNLKPDYSDFHGKRQYSALRLPGIWEGPFFSSFFFAIRMLQGGGWVQKTPDQTIRIRGKTRSEPDPRALALYERNLGVLVAICEQLGLQMLFVPQLLNYEMLATNEKYGYFPFIMDRDVKAAMDAYNGLLEKVTSSEGVPFAEDVLSMEWNADDFVDWGHFSAAGGDKFTAILAAHVPRVFGTPQTRREVP